MFIEMTHCGSIGDTHTVRYFFGSDKLWSGRFADVEQVALDKDLEYEQ